MKISLLLAIEGAGDRARRRWQQLAGDLGAVAPGATDEFITFNVADRESRDGKLLLQLAGEMGAAAELHQTATYSDEDRARAELLEVAFGDLPAAIAPQSPPGWQECPRCGIAKRYAGPAAEIRLAGSKIRTIDLLSTDYGLIVSEAVRQRISFGRGFDPQRVSAPRGTGPFFLIRAASSIGIPIDHTRWSSPCPQCGVRKGTPIDPAVPPVWEHYVYARRCWDGSDFVRDMLGTVLVSQGIWQVLRSDDWRTPEHIRSAIPVELSDAAPITSD